MRRIFASALLIAGLTCLAGDGSSQEPKGPKKDGPPPEPGTVIPPFIRPKLKLTDDQQRDISVMEFKMRGKLAKVLSDKQMQTFDEALKEGPGEMMGKDKKGPPMGKGGAMPMLPLLIIPPFVEPKLKLTQEQTRQLTLLDREARTELSKLLTDAQRKQFNELLMQGPGDMPGKKDGGDKKGPPQGRGPEEIPRPTAVGATPLKPGIQWFATWKDGQAEAERTARPILLVSGTPHCAGVSGMWCPGKQDMDETYLAHEAVIAAARHFICVRLLTYENADEAKLMKSLFVGRSGDLENSMFALLSSDGQKALAQAHRSPRRGFTTADDLADAMNRLADRKTLAPTALPLVPGFRLALNVAACDNRPLVVLVRGAGDNPKALEARLAKLAWSEACVGQFIYTAVDSVKDIATVPEVAADAAVVVIQPDRFGREGKLLGQRLGDVGPTQLATLLADTAKAFRGEDKTFPAHIRLGREAGVFWETVIPVTDPGELRARQR